MFVIRGLHSIFTRGRRKCFDKAVIFDAGMKNVTSTSIAQYFSVDANVGGKKRRTLSGIVFTHSLRMSVFDLLKFVTNKHIIIYIFITLRTPVKII